MYAVPAAAIATTETGQASETVEAWRVALERKGPVALALSRQGLPVLERENFAGAEGLARGGFVLAETEAGPDITLVATGSEVALALKARELLGEEGVSARVVDMPSWEIFEEQDEQYREAVLPRGGARISIEAGSTMGWHRYIGPGGIAVGVDTFGVSAPGGQALAQAGMTAENIVRKVNELLAIKA